MTGRASKLIWSGIEAVITSTTGNRVAVLSGPRVRIPPTPPCRCELHQVRSGLFIPCRRRPSRLPEAVSFRLLKSEGPTALEHTAQRIQAHNEIVYAARSAAYNAALPFLNGTLIQLFLAFQGVSAARIGTFNMILYIVNIAATVLLSSIAERKGNAVLQSGRIMFTQMLAYLLYPLAALLTSGTALYLILLGAAAIQMLLYASKAIFEYKLIYQITPIQNYGRLTSIAGAVIGVVGAGVGWLYARLVNSIPDGGGYLAGMLLCLLMLAASTFFNHRLRIVDHSFDQAPPAAEKKKASTLALIRMPVFRKFLVPNAIRGVTQGVMDSIALIALAMGIRESDAASLPVICSCAYIGACALFAFVEHRMSVVTIGLIGGAMTLAMIFLPHGNSTVFMLLFLIAYFGRILIDYVMPVMVCHMIDPQIAGEYNALRWVLLNICAAGTSYVVGHVVEHVSPLVLLIPAALAYGVCMVWFAVMYLSFNRY